MHKQSTLVWRRRLAILMLVGIIMMLLAPLTAWADASLPQTSLPNVSLPSPSLSGTDLPNTSLSGTSLPNTSLQGTTLPTTSLTKHSVPTPTLPNTTLPNIFLNNPNYKNPLAPNPMAQQASSNAQGTPGDWQGNLSTKTLISNGWNFTTKVIPSVYASVKGFSLKVGEKYVTVTGSRYFGNNMSLLDRVQMSGRVPGTRYLLNNPTVAKYFNVPAAIRSSFNSSYNFVKPEFWKGMKKGGGGLWSVLTVATDTYDYTLGGKKAVGVTNTDFAATVVTDVGMGIATGAVSAAAAAAAGAATGAALGSVVPGVGTVVGFGVGLTMAYLLSTPKGKAFTKVVHDGVKVGVDWSVERSKEVWSGTKDLAQGARNFVGGLFH